MSSFLYKKKDDASFDEMLSAAPESTRINKKYAVTLFEKFVDESYHALDVKEWQNLCFVQSVTSVNSAIK